MSLKLYHFPYKSKYRTRVTQDRLVLAESKKSAIKELSGLIEITDYTVSQAKTVEYDFLRIEARVESDIVYMDASIDITVTDAERKLHYKDRISHEDMTIYISQNFKTQSELLKLFKERMSEYELYSEGW